VTRVRVASERDSILQEACSQRVLPPFFVLEEYPGRWGFRFLRMNGIARGEEPEYSHREKMMTYDAVHGDLASL